MATFLFASPDFASGVARLLDFYGTFDAYNECRNGGEADSLAAYVDWKIVGDSLSDAITTFSQDIRVESGK